MIYNGTRSPLLLGTHRGMEDFRLTFDDESFGNHVMQRLFPLRERRNDESDKEKKSGNVFREVATRRPRKRDSVTVEVGHDNRHHTFADRGLPFGAEHEGFVEPWPEETQHDTGTERRGGDDSGRYGQDDGINHDREKSFPEAAIRNGACRCRYSWRSRGRRWLHLQ